ncbi:MAG: class I SAM-dependent methyltransferase [Pyrinomonadaceae bacterium]
MDEIAQYNQARWKALVEADALFTRPALNLNLDSARRRIDFDGKLGELKGKDVLCIAGGGGQQSAAFAMLGANVTVFDLSKEQLERDALAAAHYNFEIKTVQGDMRDLSCFDAASFDIVNHAYSLNFVPDAVAVFREVKRILRRGGIYYFNFANPFIMGIGQKDWNGEGYVLKEPYLSGAKISYSDPEWVYNRDGRASVPKPVEYRHTLSDVTNGLIENDFVIFHVSDSSDMHPDANAEPASWEHLVAFAPPWLSVWASYRPDFKIG